MGIMSAKKGGHALWKEGPEDILDFSRIEAFP